MAIKPKVLVISEFRGDQIHTMKPEAEILIGLVNQGLEIVLMTNADSRYIPRFEENGIRVIRFYPRSKFNLSDISFIRKELRRTVYHVLYLVTDNRAVTAGMLAAINVPVKVVLYRGLCGNLSWYDPTSYTKHLNPRVDKIICNGDAVQEYFHAQLFFNKSKTEVILKGHSLEWYKDVVASDLNYLGISKTSFVATWVGHNRQRMKGIPDMIRATYYWPEDSDMHLLLIGSNTETKKNLALARDSPNNNRIHFLGTISDPRGIVAASDVVVLASVKGEAATRFIQESMSMGIAPVITDIPGNRDLVIHNETGIVVPIRDPRTLSEAIVKLHKNPELRERLGQASKERIRTFLTHESTVQKVSELFVRLAQA